MRRVDSGHLGVVIRARPAKYLASILLACVAAVLMAVPVFGQPVSVTLVGAGDIANCNHANDDATALLVGRTLRSLTSDGALPPLNKARVITIGDNVQVSGRRSEFASCYDNYRLSDGRAYDRSRTSWWGKYKRRTMPALGNHEYYNSSDSKLRSKPYFDYFKARNGFKLPRAPVPNTSAKPGLTLGKGYYSYNLGSWHIVALNSNDRCAYVRCSGRSAQARWLRNDLAANPSRCTLAYFHHPLYASGTRSDTPEVKSLWRILYNRGADVILSGHTHRYERFRPITPDGDPSASGIRQFIVGTGGEPGGPQYGGDDPNMQVKKDGTPGVLRLNLRAGSYTWRFIPIAGQTFTDSGSDSCR